MCRVPADNSPNRSLNSAGQRQISISGQSVQNGEAAIRGERHFQHYVISYTPPSRASRCLFPDSDDLRDYVMALGYLAARVVVVDADTHWSGYRDDRLSELIAGSAA